MILNGSLPDAFRANLARLRAAQGLTQVALAERAAVAAPYVCQLEAGQRVPSMAVLARLAGALGVSPADLLKA